MNCQVCFSASEGELHYGAMSCRACAAFFRRYYNSKKTIRLCKCRTRQLNSHPCRECRVRRCLDAGMDPRKVQLQREPHKKNSESPPMDRIVSRDVQHINHSVSKWLNAQQERCSIRVPSAQVTFYDSCRMFTDDVNLMWNVMSPIFEQVDLLSTRDKRALVHNFLPKWSLYSFAVTYNDDLDFNVENVSEEERVQNIVNLYSLSIPNYASRASDEELKSVFVPFVDQYTNSFANPLIEKDLDTFEFMALTMLMIFDGAYSNLSPKCSEMCHQIRKLILRQLKAYNLDRNSDEMRFIEALDVLPMMERAVESFQRELLMCELYNVRVHEDFRALLRENNC